MNLSCFEKALGCYRGSRAQLCCCSAPSDFFVCLFFFPVQSSCCLPPAGLQANASSPRYLSLPSACAPLPTKGTSNAGGNSFNFPRLVQNKYSYNTVKHFSILETEMLAVDSCDVHVYIFSSHYISSIIYFYF